MIERHHHVGGGGGGGRVPALGDENLTAKAPAGSATVLVVDDDAAVRKSLSRMLRSAGYSVQSFATGSDFLQCEVPPGPACVLLDLQMEGMNGTEVHEALRRNGRQLPVVFLSGTATVATAVAEVKNGATDFLEKPVKLDKLIEALSQAV